MKSSDLWCNPQFHEDFYCEIHGFHEQSSDLAQRISLNPCWIWGLFHLLCLRVSVMIEVAFYTISVGLTFLLRCNVMCSIESWIFQNTDLDLNFLLYSSSSSWNPSWFGVKSSDFLVNPWINPQISWISINPWIYQIYLRTLIFPIVYPTICQIWESVKLSKLYIWYT